jgi:hypothetical protein
MASKRRLQDEVVVQELILDSDIYTSEDDISPPQSDSDSEEVDSTEWTATTLLHYLCICDTQVYRG